MKDQTDDLMDKAIKEKFAEHEVSVPSHLWESIESNLIPEKETPGGNFFFKNPFLLSILIIGTIAIGTYVYNTNETKDTTTAVSENKTTVTNNVSNNTSSSASSVHTMNETETIQTEKNQTAIAAASSEHAGHTASTVLSTNQKEKNASIHKNSKHTSATSSGNTQEKKSSSDIASSTSSGKNNSGTAGNTAAQNNSDNRKISGTSVTDKSERSTENADTDLSHAKQPEHASTITNTASATAVANNKIHNSGSANNSSTNRIASENTATRSMYADSIEQFTAAFISKENTSTDINEISTISATDVLPADKQSDQNTDPISGNLSDLNSAHAFSKPVDVAALHSNSNSTDKANRSIAADQVFATTRDMDDASGKDSAVDSATNTYSANSVYSGSDTYSSNTSIDSENKTAAGLTSKIDSILLAKEIDSVTTENVAKTMDATTTEETKKKSLFLSRCSIDGFAAPAFGYLHLSPGNPEDSITDFKERNKNSNTGFGFTTGLRMNYALTQKVEIGIGVQYSSLSQQSSFSGQHLDSSYYIYHSYTRIDSTYDSITHTTTYTTHLITDTTSANAFSTTEYVDKFQNISIPIHIAYGYSISNRFSLLARTSLLFNYQTYSVTHLNALDGTIVGHHSNKNISLGGSFSVGGYYQFSRKCSVFAEPVVTYYFSNLFDNQAPFKQTQFLFGLQTGLRLSF